MKTRHEPDSNPDLPWERKAFGKLWITPRESGWGGLPREKNLEHIATEDGRICLLIPELLDELRDIEPEKEEAALAPDPEFPLVLIAGRHIVMNANTLMRDPAWVEGKRACTLAMHPDDADALGLRDGQLVRITTEAGSEQIELEVSDSAKKGHVVIPHGFGLVYNGKAWGGKC